MLTEPEPRVADGRDLELDELDAWLVVQGLLVIEWQPSLASPALRGAELVRVRELLRRVAPLLPSLDDPAVPAGAPSLPAAQTAGAA